MGSDDGVVVNVGGQRRAVDENAGLLEPADGRVLDFDRVGAGAAMGDVVAGGEDRMVALDAGDVRAGQLVGTGDRDAVDMGVGIEHVNAEKVVVRRRIGDAGLVASVDGHAFDGDVGVALDRDDRVFGRPGRVGVRSVRDEEVRIRRLDDGLANSGAVEGDVLAVDRHLLAIGPRRDLDRVAVCGRIGPRPTRWVSGRTPGTATRRQCRQGKALSLEYAVTRPASASGRAGACH